VGSTRIIFYEGNVSFRLCVDYREMNKINKKNKYPLLYINDLFDQLHGARIFSQLDLVMRFHRLRVEKKSVLIIVFCMLSGFCEWLVMPFMRTNASAYYVDLVNHVFRDQLNKFVHVIVDDILMLGEVQFLSNLVSE